MTDGACISANVARLRLDRGLTQEGLAMKAGLSRLALGRIERGVVVPRGSTLQGLAGALDVPVGELVTPVRPLQSVRFRAKARVRSREQILAEVSKWIEGYAWLEAELGEQPGFGFGVVRPADGGSQPVAVARAARLACGLQYTLACSIHLHAVHLHAVRLHAVRLHAVRLHVVRLHAVRLQALLWRAEPSSEGRGCPARPIRRSTGVLINDFGGDSSAGTRRCMQRLPEWPRWSEKTAERVEDDIARGGHGESASAAA